MNLASDFLGIIFPQRCLICNSKSSFLVCESCLGNLKTDFNRCHICSRPLNTENSICINCLKNQNYFSKGFALFNYKTEEVSKLIELIKFYNHPELVNILFKFSHLIKSIHFLKDADCLIPVPMHRKDIKSRGYNQAVLIAKALSRITSIKVCFDCIEKHRQTRQQVGLTSKERRKNLKGAFRLIKNIPFKKIVIVDDVFTTGSTINEIASLFDKRVEKFFFCLAATPQEG